jgi:hypothetical protein
VAHFTLVCRRNGSPFFRSAKIREWPIPAASTGSFALDASLIEADANKPRSIPGFEWQKTCDRQTASRAMQEYLATHDDAVFGAASDLTPKLVSPSDPAAQ